LVWKISNRGKEPIIKKGLFNFLENNFYTGLPHYISTNKGYYFAFGKVLIKN